MSTCISRGRDASNARLTCRLCCLLGIACLPTCPAVLSVLVWEAEEDLSDCVGTDKLLSECMSLI